MTPSLNPSSETNQPQPLHPQNQPEQTVNPPEQPTQPNSEAANQEQTSLQTDADADTGGSSPPDTGREYPQHPIPSPTEPLQYRAIGLVRGHYMPSAEQFTQGTLLAEDQTLIDAVLLGKVMGLVKKHLDLSQPHLWVVYPRTRKEDNKLHVQVVGVWEPERLQKNPQPQTSDSEDIEDTSPLPDTPAVEYPDVPHNYFSIRGEVVYQSWEEGCAFVKIIQAPRKKDEDTPKFFKLRLKCPLKDKMVGHFWDFQIQRQGDDLVVQEGKDIATLREKKKKSFKGKKPGGKNPVSPQGGGDNPATATPPKRSGPPPKPVKRT